MYTQLTSLLPVATLRATSQSSPWGEHSSTTFNDYLQQLPSDTYSEAYSAVNQLLNDLRHAACDDERRLELLNVVINYEQQLKLTYNHTARGKELYQSVSTAEIRTPYPPQLYCLFLQALIANDISQRAYQYTQQQLKAKPFALFKKTKIGEHQHLLINASIRALQSHTELLLSVYLAQLELYPGFWGVVHRIYHHISEFSFADHSPTPNQAQVISSQQGSVKHNYLQLCLLGLLNLNDLESNQVIYIQHHLSEWAKQIKLAQHRSASYCAIVDPQQDTPPKFVTPSPEDNKQSEYLDLDALISHLNHQINTESSEAIQTLLQRLEKRLKSKPQRLAERVPCHIDIEMSIGFKHSVNQLSQFLSNNDNPILVGTTNEQPVNGLQLSDYVDKNTSSAHKGLATPRPKSTNLLQKLIKLSTPQIHRAKIIDISKTGYRVECSNFMPKKLTIGELVVLRPLDSDTFWACGVLRWFKSNDMSYLELGIEKISNQVFACNYSRLNQPEGQPEYSALFSPQEKSRHYLPSLIVPVGADNQDEQQIMLKIKQQEFRAMLLYKQLVTPTFVHYQLELLEPSQKPILDALMMKYQPQSNTPELWELMK